MSNTTPSRKSLSKRTRFEVFKRDSFTCQYCGRKAPDVLLECDHIDPVANGGSDDILNLVTSCHDCNSGKSDKLLSDGTAVGRKRKQLEEMQERQEQITLMYEWQKSLALESDMEAVLVSDYWSELNPGWRLSDDGMSDLRKMLRRFGMPSVMEAMRIAVDGYGPVSETNDPFIKVGGICFNRSQPEEYQSVNHIRSIANKRCPHYFNKGIAGDIIRGAIDAGVSETCLMSIAATCHNWTDWNHMMSDAVSDDE